MDYMDYAVEAAGSMIITMSFIPSCITAGKTGHLVLLKHITFLLPGLFL